ncbi:MAG TPA: putative metalloprotease CJM1_0395 family protein [Candidatus Hydrogenedentes bacterium]|nr:putative metalloprotease CJM1_0395 family protein [Candidatus Hydrogenedentota bacterium]
MAEIGVSAISDAYLGRVTGQYEGSPFFRKENVKNSPLQGIHKGTFQKTSGPSPLSAENRVEKRGQNTLNELTGEEKEEVRNLKQRDAEVRRHEQAHLSAAGRYARGGAHYTYTRGPDGRLYATGGEVSLDVSPTRTPQGTITKAGVLKAAALAPAKPSAQDRAVAAAAGRMESEARAELAKLRIEESQRQGEDTPPLAPKMPAYSPRQNPFINNDFDPTAVRGTRQLDLRV